MQAEDEQALREVWEHIDLVMRLLGSAQIELMRRQFTHDRSKLTFPEWGAFASVANKLPELPYGSPEYEAQRRELLLSTLGHHYENNRHHPEFFGERNPSKAIESHLEVARRVIENNRVASDDIPKYRQLINFVEQKQAEHISPINKMNLFDLLEMFIDWYATVERHRDGDIKKSIEVNQRCFALSPQVVEIFINTIEWVRDEFENLETQKI